MSALIGKLRRGLRKPPIYLVSRACQELRVEAERYLGPRRACRLTQTRLLSLLGFGTPQDLWQALRSNPRLGHFSNLTIEQYDEICPGDGVRILAAAESALRHEVDLLGSGKIQLGSVIDWHKDYKTDLSWPRSYHRAIEYGNPERPSDVKFPWELSRLQWLIPAGQAYLLSQDERFALAARSVLEQWIDANPCGYGVNWACTMEPSLRILTWTWLFHVFAGSDAWSDGRFQYRFLRTLFLHGDFVARHLEKADINGNHYTANAAGLVFAGLFFGQGSHPLQWARSGWRILLNEFPKQVFEDGVDFEASVSYHRLVFELFLYPALYRRARGMNVPYSYWRRLRRMAEFTEAYSRKDGSTPLWGDADDARALPFGGQTITDHRYLMGIAGQILDPVFNSSFSGPKSEIFWLLGTEAAQNIKAGERSDSAIASKAFAHGGFYIMRHARDHVFIDCGPVGLAGRGGHGHNDLLSFEAMLSGVRLIVDPGSYVYTADCKSRNRFRSTAFHNTVQLDDEEINRFTGPLDLWTLHNDAEFTVNLWSVTKERSAISMSRTGFEGRQRSARVTRDITLNHADSTLTISDRVDTETACRISIPFHFDPQIAITQTESGFDLRSDEATFLLTWSGTAAFAVEQSDCMISPSYGVLLPSQKLVFRSGSEKQLSLRVVISSSPPTSAR